ncbi:LIC_10705 family lipoprotein [Leptospira stimsonii]|uniref:Lipoprotein n=1 Tax=Leptospira stimsonii TaxID=2202203 RepID=A0ABY2N1M4_9LEPT|nr:LIC_10705 family lipoprotein [Leptospira stimsonii]TGK20476.1 hypothetical protein EHO98_08460 [Leptospira stimsonii]TGM14266.1 hypothetical protein EHQ90_11655 [Leptospira stimsonii]
MKRILGLLGLICLFTVHCNGEFENSNKGTTNGLDNNFLLTYSLFFVVPNLDYNQFCPPTDQIPILEPGTYARFMKAGDTFIFDNRARLNAYNPGSLFEYFTFSFQENPGQEIQLVTPDCGLSAFEYRARQDSNFPGQLENVYIGLKTPPLGQTRSRFFIKFKVTAGSGTFTFTTPAAQDPPH